MPNSPTILKFPKLTLTLLAMAQFIVAVDYNIVYVALPSIGVAFGLSPQNLQWVISAYALTFGCLLLLGGRLGDVIGRRNAFVIALGLYAISSLAGGLAPNGVVLILARAVQGFGGALLIPATLSLLSSFYPEGPARNSALAWFGAAGASGGASGVLLGGVLTSGLSWHWTFYVNVPVAAGLALAAFSILPRDGITQSKSLDVPGAAAITASLALLVLASGQGPDLGWTSAPILMMMAGFIILLGLFFTIEARSSAPLVPLRLFAHPTLPAAMIVAALFMGAFGAQFYLLTTYLQNVRLYPPALAGLAFLPFSFAVIAGTRLGGRLAGTVGLRNGLLIGLAIGIVGLLVNASSLSTGGNYIVQVLPGFVLDGLGQGTIFTLVYIAATSGIDALDRGIASGMAATAQWVGNALGLSILVAIAGPMLSLGSEFALEGLRTGFLTAAGIAALAVVVVIIRFDTSTPARAARQG